MVFFSNPVYPPCLRRITVATGRILLISLFWIAVLTGPAASSEPSGLFSIAGPDGAVTSFSAGEMLPITLNHELLDQLTRKGETFTVSLFPGDPGIYRITGVSEFVEGYRSVRAVHENNPHDQITFTYGNGQVVGTVDRFNRGESYHIRQNTTKTSKAASETGTGHVLYYRNPEEENILECGVNHDLHSGAPTPAPADGYHDHSSLFSPFDIETSETSMEAGVPIDLMIIYTNDAKSWAENNENPDVNNIDQLIAQMMNLSQQALDNSKLGIELRVVRIYNTEFQENGHDSPGDLRKLTAMPGDDRFESQHLGHMDHIHDMRDVHGADLVAMIADVADVGGIAWLLNSISGASQWGFSLNNVRQVATTYTLVHEIGHNMGNAHAREQQNAPADAFGGLFEYSTGWRFLGENRFSYATIMTYPELQSDRIPYFSNPDILFEGVPTGSYDAPNAPADNARNMRLTRHMVANYRMSQSHSPQVYADESVIQVEAEPDSVGEIRLTLGNDGNSTLHWTVDAAYPEVAPIAKDARHEITRIPDANADLVPAELATPWTLYRGSSASLARLSPPYLDRNRDRMIRRRNGSQFFSNLHSDEYSATSPDVYASTSNDKTGDVSVQTGEEPLPPGTLFYTGFENDEGFEVGEHLLYNNFTPTPRDSLAKFEISTDHPSSGSQHLRLRPVTGLNEGRTTGVRLPFLGPLTTQGYSISMDLRFSDDDSENQFHVIMDEASSGQNSAWVWFEEGNIAFRNQIGGQEFYYLNNPVSPGQPLWKAGEYFNFEIRIDPVNDRIQYLVDGVFVQTDNYYGGAAPEDILFAHTNYHTGETFDIDNVTITMLKDVAFPGMQMRKESGAIAAGDQQEITFNIITDDIPDEVYEFDLRVHTNDPLQKTLSIPVRLTVNGSTVSADPEPLANDFELFPNFPNPFNPVTVIRYRLPVESEVRLEVYDLLGRRMDTLVDAHTPAGTHEVTFDATGLSSGVYLYRLQAGSYEQVERMMLVK